MKKIAFDFGPVDPPPGVETFDGGSVSGLATLLNILLKTMIVGAGIYTVITLILAGYAFISAGGDPKQIQVAWSKIWQSLLGLIIAAAAVVIAAILGEIFFGDPNAILEIRYFTP